MFIVIFLMLNVIFLMLNVDFLGNYQLLTINY